MESRRYTVLSLFSGGMGLDLGLKQTGQFQLLACVEVAPSFGETIRRNRDAGRIGSPALNVYQQDVAELDPVQVMADLRLAPGELDLVAGGPPCQAFSVFGKRRGLADRRGQLIFEFLRFIEALRPRVFLMENVRGLLSMTTDDSTRKGSLFEMVQGRFDALGYRSDCFVVNAVNYGAPQVRERILMIGNRYGATADFPQPTHSDRPGDHLSPFATLGDAIRGKPDPDPTIMQFSERKQKYLAMVPPGGNWRTLPVEIQRESMGKTFYLKGGRSAYWRKLSYEFPCPTVITMPNHAGTSMCHPEFLRPLTVGECIEFKGSQRNGRSAALRARNTSRSVTPSPSSSDEWRGRPSCACWNRLPWLIGRTRNQANRAEWSRSDLTYGQDGGGRTAKSSKRVLILSVRRGNHAGTMGRPSSTTCPEGAKGNDAP